MGHYLMTFALFTIYKAKKIEISSFNFSDHGVRDGTLLIPSLTLEDFGEYVCTASNRFGRAESVVILEHTGGKSS